MRQQATVDPRVEARETEFSAPSPKTPSVPLLIRYLQEIGKTDLLSREREKRKKRSWAESCFLNPEPTAGRREPSMELRQPRGRVAVPATDSRNSSRTNSSGLKLQPGRPAEETRS